MESFSNFPDDVTFYNCENQLRQQPTRRKWRLQKRCSASVKVKGETRQGEVDEPFAKLSLGDLVTTRNWDLIIKKLARQNVTGHQRMFSRPLKAETPCNKFKRINKCRLFSLFGEFFLQRESEKMFFVDFHSFLPSVRTTSSVSRRPLTVPVGNCETAVN